jgi:NAD(P)-dependent dehydrogenase (short-subunit alcohol dehydrogenase family)
VKTIVITGGTRGLGRGLADAFLARDCAVMITGRNMVSVEGALAELGARHSPDRLAGQTCDVTRYDDLEALWDIAARRFGRIDVWINNAGSAHEAQPVRELDPATIRTVIETNLIGTIYGARVALRGMIAQGGGQIYNMEGYGSDGSMRAEMPISIYGTSKYAVRYLSRALALEVKNTPVLVGTLSPGMLATEMISGQYVGRPQEWERARRILNIFAERVETVAPWLADRVLSNRKNGACIRWLTPLKLAGYFALAPFRKREVFGPVE